MTTKVQMKMLHVRTVAENFVAGVAIAFYFLWFYNDQHLPGSEQSSAM